MRTQTSYFLIGSFVIGGLVLLTGALVSLSSDSRRRDVIKAETLFEESVSGLEVGAPVRFRGVSVGRVTQISVAGALYSETQQTYVVVRFELWGPAGLPVERLRATLPKRIDEGLRVRQASTGVTGVSFLEADILDDAHKYPPKKRDWMPDEPRGQFLYVPSAPSTFGEVVNSVERVLDDVARADLPQVARDIRDAVASLQAQVSEAGLGELRADVGRTLAEARDAARQVVKDFERAVAGFEATTRSVSATAATLDGRIGDPQIDAILVDVRAASGELKGLVSGAKATLGDAQLLLAGRAGAIASILTNLERASAHLRTLTATAEQYPSWLLFGTPPERGRGR